MQRVKVFIYISIFAICNCSIYRYLQHSIQDARENEFQKCRGAASSRGRVASSSTHSRYIICRSGLTSNVLVGSFLVFQFSSPKHTHTLSLYVYIFIYLYPPNSQSEILWGEDPRCGGYHRCGRGLLQCP